MKAESPSNSPEVLGRRSGEFSLMYSSKGASELRRKLTTFGCWAAALPGCGDVEIVGLVGRSFGELREGEGEGWIEGRTGRFGGMIAVVDAGLLTTQNR